jgi:hypothetical protein
MTLSQSILSKNDSVERNSYGAATIVNSKLNTGPGGAEDE